MNVECPGPADPVGAAGSAGPAGPLGPAGPVLPAPVEGIILGDLSLKLHRVTH